MTARKPFTNPSAYVEEHRDDLIHLLCNDEPMVRALALTVLIEGGGEADLDLVERELQIARELDDDVREEVFG